MMLQYDKQKKYRGNIEKFSFKINNAQVDNAKYIDFEMVMYILIEYGDNYSKRFRKFMAIL